MNQLLTRCVTASVLLAVLLIAVLTSHSAPYLLMLCAGLAWGAAFIEFLILVRRATNFPAVIVSVLACAVVVCVCALGHSLSIPSFVEGLIVGSVSVLCLVAGRAPSFEKSTRIIFYSLVAACVFGLGGAGLLRIVLDLQENRGLSLWLVGLVVLTDVGAYAVGHLLGGPKLAPAISPGKTISGAIGGLLICMVSGPYLAQTLGLSQTGLHLPFAAVLISLAAQSGDLLESLVKRLAGVKDSGKLLPGHGGMYDRIDGLLAAAALLPFLLKY